MVALRGAVAMCAALALAGCSSPPGTKAASTSAPRNDIREYDLARLGDIAKDLPAGFVPSPFEVAELDPAYVDAIGDLIAYGRPLTVVPARCRSLLKPVDGQRGASTNGTRAAGPDGQAIVVNATAPVTVLDGAPKTECDRITFDVEDDAVRTRGTAERITVPSIEGASTEALKIVFDDRTELEYHYGAIVDDRLYVDVAARLPPNSNVERLLPELLVKAVAAVRAG